MKTAFLLAAAGAATFAAGLAGAQTYSTYPTYGYGGAPGMVVRCESINSRSNFCRADTRGGVEVYRQLSRQNCIRGRNWRAVSGGIVVDDGCRADFAVATGNGTQVYTSTDRYGRPIYDARSSTYNRGYSTDAYGRPIYDNRYPTYSNGGYTTDRYGNRVFVGSTGSSSGGYYSTDRYGNRVWVESYGNSNGGYYTTDRYGNRVFVPASGNTRVYDDDYDDYDETYRRNVELGPPGYGGGTYTSPTTTYGTDVIHCQPSTYGRTYCGDRTRTYTLRFDNSAACVLDRTYGRDSYGTWVSNGCSIRMEGGGY